MPFYPRKKKTKMTGVVRKRGGAAKLSKPVVKAVKRIVKGQQETKYISHLVENGVLHNSPIGGADQYRVLPYLVAGTGEWNRIGDKVRPVSLTVKGQVAIAPLIASAGNYSPILVRVLCLQLKSAHYWPQALNGWSSGAYAALLKNNDETGNENIPYGGDNHSNFIPVNRDAFDVLGERFIMLGNRTDGMMDPAAPGTLAKTFSMKIKTPTVLHYGAGPNQNPENYAPFLAVGYSYMDGTAPDAINTSIIVTARSALSYKDA